MTEYAIYLRKSRKDVEAEARGEGETLARHERTLLELARRQHLNVTEIYREVVSGETIASRPVMQQLLSEVEQGLWAGVLVMEVERLARGDTIDQGIIAQAFKFSDTRIITPLKTYDPNNEYDEEYFEFGLFMSRREYKTINRRLQRGRVTSVTEGKYVANKAPYGYRRVKLEHEKGWTLEPHPEEAEVIRMIFDLYTSGEKQEDGSMRRLGISLIVRRLNNLKIPTRNGNGWVPATIRDILNNPTYTGKVRWNCRPAVKRRSDGQVVVSRPRASEYLLVKGLHPPIVDQAVWDAAQVLMKQNPPPPVGDRSTVKSPLAGLVVCAKCGRRLVRRPYYGKNTQPTLMCPATSCDNVSVALHYVEERILDGLEEWLGEYKLKWATEVPSSKKVSQVDVKRKALKKVETELDNLEKQRNNLYDLLEQKVYSIDIFVERSKLLSERVTQAQADREVLENELTLELAREDSRKNIIPKVEHLLDVYDSLPTAKAKNDMLKEVLDKVVYLKEKNGRWHNAPDDFQITLYPKLPVIDQKK